MTAKKLPAIVGAVSVAPERSPAIAEVVSRVVHLEPAYGKLRGFCPLHKSIQGGPKLVIEGRRAVCKRCGAFNAEEFAKALADRIIEKLDRQHPGDCSGLNADGSPCRRGMAFPNGRCAAHGGSITPQAVAAEVNRMREESLLRMERWQRWRLAHEAHILKPGWRALPRPKIEPLKAVAASLGLEAPKPHPSPERAAAPTQAPETAENEAT